MELLTRFPMLVQGGGRPDPFAALVGTTGPGRDRSERPGQCREGRRRGAEPPSERKK